ncbi:MAG: GDCCVxC domain-containing (seleno)protein [archaeon]|jgi:hypothetical protein|nr:hypothetical protein [Euryarchaeota archaeon]MDP6704358.1 GDCCVxC domain-containing (seleno)protein [archaeon]HIK01330.1 hypothetical protein [Candidatus Undinarchaeales archaeon ERR594346 U_76725]|tara:strand:+ start:524 stop:727 length:204 start_codon:yes stop_codon:yes gene_type:complete
MAEGIITCPKCGHKQGAEIPEAVCQFSYLCFGCKETILSETKCCVFCDYGDRSCHTEKKETEVTIVE